jgi:hypothetical protein
VTVSVEETGAGAGEEEAVSAATAVPAADDRTSTSAATAETWVERRIRDIIILRWAERSGCSLWWCGDT